MNLPVKAFFDGTSPFYDDIFDSSKTYADYKQWVNSVNPWRPSISVFVLYEDVEYVETCANQIFDELEKDNYRGRVIVCVIADADLYESITRKNENKIFKQNGETMFAFAKRLN